MGTPFPISRSFSLEIRKIWYKFQTERYPLRLIIAKSIASQQKNFQNFIKKTLKQLRIANKLLGTNYTSWSQFKLTPKPISGTSEALCNQRDLWKIFVKKLPVKAKKYSSSELAKRRYEEAQASAKIAELFKCQILPNGDCMLVASLENRMRIVKIILHGFRKETKHEE